MKTTICFIQISLVIFIFSAEKMFAQGFVPEFQTPFYFEDALGHKDTVLIGYSSSLPLGAPRGEYNPISDGSLITAPFDSVFEVRLFHTTYWNNINAFTTKSMTVNYETYPNSSCGLSEGACLTIHSKYPPVTMHYDSTLFSPNSCRSNTIFTPDWQIYFEQFWWNATFQCVGGRSSILPDLALNPFNLNLPDVNIEGGTTRTLPGYFLIFKSWGACTDSTLIVNTNTLFQKDEGIHIFPNPTTDKLNITVSAEEIVEWSVYNILGQLEYVSVVKSKSTDQSFTMETSGLPPGTYFLLGQQKKGVKSYPFVVQRQ